MALLILATALLLMLPLRGASAQDETPMGAWVSAGTSAWIRDGISAGARLEVGIPIRDLPLGHLSLALPVIFAPERVDILGLESKWFRVHIAPTLRWEWPLLERWGRLIVWGEAGGGVLIDRYTEPGGGGVPAFDDTTLFGVIRFAAGATFIFPFGLMLTSQPFGVMGTVGHDLGQGHYETSFLVGYRFNG